MFRHRYPALRMNPHIYVLAPLTFDHTCTVSNFTLLHLANKLIGKISIRVVYPILESGFRFKACTRYLFLASRFKDNLEYWYTG